jgi:hypothetical protein
MRGSHASGKGFALSFFEIFDFPEMAINCTRRMNSTTPLQSLALMNSGFVLEHSGYLAKRIRHIVGGGASPEQQIETAFMLALGRLPSVNERHFCLEYLRRQTKLYRQAKLDADASAFGALSGLCSSLLASNEFLYIG